MRPGDLRVLFVTGAYAPEFSAGGLQCQAIARVVGDRLAISVLTTATKPTLPSEDSIEGVPVTRVHVEPGGSAGLGPSMALVTSLGRLLPENDLVHIQGFSKKNVLILTLARMFRRAVILHLQTARHDEPPAIKAQGAMAWWAFSSADHLISVSPGLKAAAIDGGIPAEKIGVIPNGVDVRRFAPATADEKRALRSDLGLPADHPVILFVGVIAPDKQPHILLDAWAALQSDKSLQSTLVFVGATNPALYELGDNLAEAMKATVATRQLADRVRFVEPTNEVEKYFRASDMLVMPTLREGCPNVLLEAMACGLPAVASRLPGSTDAIIEHGVNGLLVDVGDVEGFARAIGDLLRDPDAAARMGTMGRRTIEAHYRIEDVAERWLATYRALLER